MKNKYHIGYKTLWEKEKLLVTSNFSFSHNVFHSYISIVHQNTVSCGNGLITSLWKVYLYKIYDTLSLKKGLTASLLYTKQVTTQCYWAISLFNNFLNIDSLISTSNFSFSHNVFHSYISLVCQNAVLLDDKILALSKSKAFWWARATLF